MDSLDYIAAMDRLDPHVATEQILNFVSSYAEPDQIGWGLGNSGAGYTYDQDIFEKVRIRDRILFRV